MHIAVGPERYLAQVVGNGHCVPFVQRVSKVGLASTWRRGARVRGNNIPRNAVIATFVPDGRGGWRYGNRRGGSSHAAILLSEEADGIRVYDQWLGRPVGQRLIRWRNGVGTANNDGDAYYVVVT